MELLLMMGKESDWQEDWGSFQKEHTSLEKNSQQSSDATSAATFDRFAVENISKQRAMEGNWHSLVSINMKEMLKITIQSEANTIALAINKDWL